MKIVQPIQLATNAETLMTSGEYDGFNNKGSQS